MLANRIHPLRSQRLLLVPCLRTRGGTGGSTDSTALTSLGIERGSGTLTGGADSFALPSTAAGWAVNVTWTTGSFAGQLFVAAKVGVNVTVASSSGAADDGETFDYIAVKL